MVGVGSSGTISGMTSYFREHAPQVEIVLADPEGSVLADYIDTGKLGPSGSWLVEGIGEDFIPDICDLSLVTQAYTISDAESFAAARELLAEGRHAGRLVVRHVAGRGAALLPRADRAQARGELCLRHRQQVPVQAVQRFLDGRSGLYQRESMAICAT